MTCVYLHGAVAVNFTTHYAGSVALVLSVVMLNAVGGVIVGCVFVNAGSRPRSGRTREPIVRFN